MSEQTCSSSYQHTAFNPCCKSFDLNQVILYDFEKLESPTEVGKLFLLEVSIDFF